ncbi:MAG: hypothetical protein LBH43_12330 [Treponema sp.]|jgi:hypothetical protein|nr:hypothetical protein [Treponema sp.]
MADLRNKYGDVVYRIEGDRIIDIYGNWKYEIRNEYIFDTYGNRKFEIRDEWLFDTNGSCLGEMKNLADFLDPISDSGSSSSSSGNIRHFPKREESSGCLGWIFSILVFLIFSNWGGRIGVIIGGVFSVIMIIQTFSDDLPVGNLFLIVPFALLACGIIGAIIGAIVGFIKKLINKR